jgi:hypothetical protein
MQRRGRATAEPQNLALQTAGHTECRKIKGCSGARVFELTRAFVDRFL